ncbi:hypothetical protein F8M41_003269 [Gigaspora margarita]|uniref:Uncharacterized protein n=1 Tax=Gigaspora margarita TaxID=4874 RepID=A0A8H3XBI4_GIGMA|nr:hypothetical protein F8M41_003269 [Gigaspora margarita]
MLCSYSRPLATDHGTWLAIVKKLISTLIYIALMLPRGTRGQIISKEHYFTATARTTHNTLLQNISALLNKTGPSWLIWKTITTWKNLAFEFECVPSIPQPKPNHTIPLYQSRNSLY